MAIDITTLLDEDIMDSLDEQSYVQHILPLLSPESNVTDEVEDEPTPSMAIPGHFHEFDAAFWG